MTHIQQLNFSFISILSNPFSQDAWADFDLLCIFLNKDGLKFKQHDSKFNSSYKIVKFQRKQQLEFINIEIKKALDQQFFEYLNQLLMYRKVISGIRGRLKRKIKVYEMDYFIEKENVIWFQLIGFPLIDLKISMIIARRRRQII